MPYISNTKRVNLDSYIDILLGLAHSDGEMNYIITKLIDGHYGDKNYSSYNSALGVLEAVKQEYYRRKIGIYEDRKIKENGDVF